MHLVLRLADAERFDVGDCHVQDALHCFAAVKDLGKLLTSLSLSSSLSLYRVED